MAQRFRGTSTHKVDAKGRVSIPADFRRVLDAQDPDRDPGTNPSVVLLYGDTRNPWFDCYSVQAMEEIDELIDRMDEGDPDRLTLEEYFYSNAETMRIDDSGRLVLSQSLREQIGIGSEAVFQARGKTFRIFSPDVPTQATSRLKTRLDEMPPEVPVTSLLPARRRDPAE
ncbi:division/cell wall cluster transcriptional repressor MraZ [Jannaschia aquimarina]|uniref:Transcriptional regulator MraZ n=1 Tax=Jannaschia aquimarina TaxID=935700 RepID=A0A0D1CQ26_9RHOB|nr:division/cell wall cluster transcriptional repressor MraZ [Jannaschia aquimarina]KIT16832.1 Protein MraZ [Jannaschia aquimarina]SNT13353.1 MraZ protein [Jannaschia aquimarina]